MAAVGPEKDWEANHGAGGQEAVETEPLEQVVTEKELRVNSRPDGAALSATRSAQRSTLSRLQSSVTDASEPADDKSWKEEPQRKKWYKRLNPLRWGPTPPVPKERRVSREKDAGFFSLLTFQWMAPLMNVSVRPVMEVVQS